MSPRAHALLRIVAGFLFLWHGVQKIFGFPDVPGGTGSLPFDVRWIAGSIELVGGLLVMLGLRTRGAAFLCSGLMAVAYWRAHGMEALLPIQNGGETAALFCFVFLFLAAAGPGTWSLEVRLKRKAE